MNEFKGFLKLLEKECIKGRRLIPIPHDYAMDILSHIKLLEEENQQLKNKINNLTNIGRTIFTGKNYNDLALENEKLKKQKDDVVEYIKEKTKEFHFENDKLIDILRILGEIE